MKAVFAGRRGGSVFVDDLRACSPSRVWRHETSCHLYTLPGWEDELHAFAAVIGLRRGWFQERPMPHYDLTDSKRRLALAAGAREASRQDVRDALRSWRADRETRLSTALDGQAESEFSRHRQVRPPNRLERFNVAVSPAEFSERVAALRAQLQQCKPMNTKEIPFRVSYCEITAELAAEWLGLNTKNRKMRQPSVAAFARDMVSGEWIPNHQGIAFGDTGALIDGQHRLAAIVASKTPVWMLVFRGVPERPPGKRLKTIGSIDRGAPRSIADYLQIENNVENHAAFFTACARIVAGLAGVPGDRLSKVTLAEVLGVLDALGPAAHWLARARPAARPFHIAPALAPFLWIYQLDPAGTEKRLNAFVAGAGLAARSPILAARNFLISSSSGGRCSRHDRQMLSGVILYCLGEDLAGKKLERITPGRLAPERLAAIRELRADLLARCSEIFPAVARPRPDRRKKSAPPAAAPVIRKTELPRGVANRRDLIAQLAGGH